MRRGHENDGEGAVTWLHQLRQRLPIIIFRVERREVCTIARQLPADTCTELRILLYRVDWNKPFKRVSSGFECVIDIFFRSVIVLVYSSIQICRKFASYI